MKKNTNLNAVDLHVHSNRSDGTFSPRELVDYAKEKGLRAFALTDHDTIDGLEEAISYARELAAASEQEPLSAIPEVIPGIEFSTEYQGQDIHIVGLYIDYENKSFQEQLQRFVDSRTLRNQKMCRLLQGAGIDITYEKLLKEFPDAVITRAHYAKYLLNHGYIKSMNEAFKRYVGDRCPYFVPREKVTPVQAVKLILQADGIPVLAHPILYRMSNARLETLVAQLKEAGLMAIEAIYSTYNAGEERQIRSLADKYRLLISGGSDFHGSNKPGLDLAVGYGRLLVPGHVLDELQKSRQNLLFTDLDGTLLLNNSTVSPDMKAALQRMTRSGHRLILTSGRPLPSILGLCEQLGLMHGQVPAVPNLLIISNNGSLIYDCGRQAPVLEHRICQKDIAYLTQKAHEAGLHIHGYTDREIVCLERNSREETPELQYYRRRIHMPLKCVPDIAAALPQGSYKLQLIHLTDHAALEDFRENLLSYCSGRLQMIFSNQNYLEILPAQAGKGNALHYVTSYLPALPSRTYAAGDAENDISMLKAAHIGIAMQNAAPEVKAAAQIITGQDNEHDGLLEILYKYFA